MWVETAVPARSRKGPSLTARRVRRLRRLLVRAQQRQQHAQPDDRADDDDREPRRPADAARELRDRKRGRARRGGAGAGRSGARRRRDDRVGEGDRRVERSAREDHPVVDIDKEECHVVAASVVIMGEGEVGCN